MSKFHGEQQYWTTMRQKTLQDWHDLSDDEFDTLRALQHDREIRERGLRDRMKRGGRIDPKELEL
jgi:hypothetical protein